MLTICTGSDTPPQPPPTARPPQPRPLASASVGTAVLGRRQDPISGILRDVHWELAERLNELQSLCRTITRAHGNATINHGSFGKVRASTRVATAQSPFLAIPSRNLYAVLSAAALPAVQLFTAQHNRGLAASPVPSPTSMQPKIHGHDTLQLGAYMCIQSTNIALAFCTGQCQWRHYSLEKLGSRAVPQDPQDARHLNVEAVTNKLLSALTNRVNRKCLPSRVPPSQTCPNFPRALRSCNLYFHNLALVRIGYLLTQLLCNQVLSSDFLHQ